MNIEFSYREIEALSFLFVDCIKPSNQDLIFWSWLKRTIERKILKKKDEPDGFDKNILMNVLKQIDGKVGTMVKTSEKAYKKRKAINKSPIVTHPLNKPLETTDVDRQTKQEIKQPSDVKLTNTARKTTPRTYLKKNEMKSLVIGIFNDNEQLDVGTIRDRLEDKGMNRSRHTVYEWVVALEKNGVLELHKMSGYPRSPNEYTLNVPV